MVERGEGVDEGGEEGRGAVLVLSTPGGRESWVGKGSVRGRMELG